MHARAPAGTTEPLTSPAVLPGSGLLQFTRIGPRTVVSRAFASSPLKLLTPRNAGEGAWVYLSTYGGGLVDGDELSLSVEVGPDALALVSTQASTKVYRSPRGSGSQLFARVSSGGRLVVLPDPVVCFASAKYRQVQTFDLAPDAGLIMVDWLTSGRRARGERWQFDRYDSRTSIHIGGRLIAYDALRLHADDGDIGGRLGRFNVVAAVAVVGVPFASYAKAIVSRVEAHPVRERAGLLLAASALGDAGCLLRAAGVSVEEVGRTIRDHLAFLSSALGDDPWARKW
jgi:urease accessory protein